MLKKVLFMPYIVVTAILLGVILPIWKVEMVELGRSKQTWKEHMKKGLLELAVVEAPSTRKWLTYSEKRLVHCPRMPCETVILLN